MQIAKLTVFFLMIPFFCLGIDVKPWINKEYEVEIHSEVLYQQYKSIQIPHHEFKRKENDVFWSLSMAFPFRRYRGEFEITTAKTKEQNYTIDNFRISFAYNAWDDREGDPFCLMGGMILTEPYSRALHDISSFHHGHLDAEFFLSIGKTLSCICHNGYMLRCWNVCGIGCTDVGSSWVREDVACEGRLGIQFVRLFANTLWGLGKRNICLRYFKGYGPIHHQSVDVGIRYGCDFEYYGTLSIQYARRVLAHNFPQQANLVMLKYDLPFGTQDSTTY